MAREATQRPCSAPTRGPSFRDCYRAPNPQCDYDSTFHPLACRSACQSGGCGLHVAPLGSATGKADERTAERPTKLSKARELATKCHIRQRSATRKAQPLPWVVASWPQRVRFHWTSFVQTWRHRTARWIVLVLTPALSCLTHFTQHCRTAAVQAYSSSAALHAAVGAIMHTRPRPWCAAMRLLPTLSSFICSCSCNIRQRPSPAESSRVQRFYLRTRLISAGAMLARQCRCHRSARSSAVGTPALAIAPAQNVCPNALTCAPLFTSMLTAIS